MKAVNLPSGIKRILPLEINYKIRRFKQLIIQKTPSFDERAKVAQKRVFFLDAPAYENIGDQAITYAMELFVKNCLPQYEQFEIQEDILPHYYKWLKRNIREDDLICLTGGGNMGVMYQSYEATRRAILRMFADNRIIIFPQTIDYGNSRYGKKELQRSIKLYNSCRNLIVTGREYESYKKMKYYYNNAEVIFCPDIVLSLDYTFLNSGSRHKVGVCMRNDEERILDSKSIDLIKDYYTDTIELSTYVRVNKRIIGKTREKLITSVLRQFASCKLVITDRLHGTIFSFITNTPCIALPNSNGKVERVSGLLKEYGRVVFQNSFSPVEFPSGKNKMVSREFEELKNVVTKSGEDKHNNASYN